MVVTLLLSFTLRSIFQDSPGDVSHLPLLLLMVGLGGFGIPTRHLGGFLEGLQRFYINELDQRIATLLRTCADRSRPHRDTGC